MSENAFPSPRPEAAPHPLQELSDGQRDALHRILGMLHAMADEPWEPTKPLHTTHRYLPRIDSKRTNRVLLIDGERGSGKSVLLLTVLDLQVRRLIGSPTGSPEQTEQLAIDDRVVPVGLLDLQPLPQSTDLLLHLMSRFERLVNSLEPKPAEDARGIALWNEAATEQRNPLRQKWEDFTRCAASWQENFRARMSRLDPDNYAIEAIEGEFERSRLMDVFREFFDSLVETYSKNHRPGPRTPLFLLAIDDADMNPGLSVSLLELMRKFWHPRLAFLMTGNSEQFVDQIKRALLDSRRLPGEDDRAKAEHLARAIYGKDVPRPQRFDLGELTLEERARIVPEIRATLDRFKVLVTPPLFPAGKPNPSLLDYLSADVRAAALVPGHPRQLLDFGSAVTRIASSIPRTETGFEPILLADGLWEYLCKENAEDNSVRRAAQIDILAQNILLDTTRLQLRLKSDQTRIQQNSFTLVCAYPVDFDVSINNHETPQSLLGSSNSKSLGKTLAGAWLFLLDLVADSGRGGFTADPTVTMDKAAPAFAFCSWETDRYEGNVQVPWPIPDWPAPLDYWRFGKHWREALLEGQAFRGRDIDLLARQFLYLTCRIAHDRSVLAENWWQETPAWSALAQKVAELGKSDRSTLRGKANARWAVERAGLLFAPEAGLPAQAAQEFLDALNKAVDQNWLQYVEGLESSRLDHLRRGGVDEKQIEKLLARFDKQEMEHAFLKLFGQGRSASSPNHVQSFFDSLQRFTLASQNQQHDSLARYRTSIRTKLLEKPPHAILTVARKVTSSLANVYNVTSIVAISLWQKAAELINPLQFSDWFKLSGKHIVIASEPHAVAERLHKHLLEAEGRPAFTQAIQVDEVRSIHAFRLKSATRRNNDDLLPPPLDAIFRIVFDYAVDQQPPETPNRKEHRSSWSAVSVTLQLDRSISLHPWPLVLPMTLIEAEQIGDGWSRLVDSINAILEPGNSSVFARLGDAIALAYLGDWQSWLSRSHGGHSLNLDAGPNDFLGAIRTLVDTTDKRKLILLPHALLLATPEAATSDGVASALLDQASELHLAQLPGLRRERTMRDDGILESGVDALLAAIDERFPEHPWVQRFNKHQAKRS